MNTRGLLKGYWRTWLSFVWCVALLLLVAILLCMGATAADNATVWSIRVIDAAENKPLAGCVVTNGDYAALAEGAISRTNAKGECTCVEKPVVLQIPNGGPEVHIHPQHGFWVHCGGYVSQHIEPSSTTTPKPDSDPLIVRMVRGRRLAGRVVRSDNSPVSHEPALLVGNTDDWPVQHEILTDEKGGFSWSEAPQGKVFIVMGVDKSASSAVFEELNVTDDTAVVQVPRNWQGLGKKTAAKLVYLRQSPTGPILPALWNVEGRAFFLASAIESSPDPINHVILSFSGRRASADCFGVGGKNHSVRMRGEVLGEEDTLRQEGTQNNPSAARGTPSFRR